LLIGFILFRVFDIFKPYPINRSQKLKAGWGIMIDDALAGIYANTILQVVYLSGLF
jgi:phosphatidylglycerophosphatase A